MDKGRAIISFDLAIKTVLRDKANFDVLEGFLSALLGERIAVLELLESESNRPEEDLKSNRVDLMVRDSRGRHLIVELQYTPETAFGTKPVSQGHSGNPSRGDWVSSARRAQARPGRDYVSQTCAAVCSAPVKASLASHVSPSLAPTGTLLRAHYKRRIPLLSRSDSADRWKIGHKRHKTHKRAGATGCAPNVEIPHRIVSRIEMAQR